MSQNKGKKEGTTYGIMASSPTAVTAIIINPQGGTSIQEYHPASGEESAEMYVKYLDSLASYLKEFKVAKNAGRLISQKGGVPDYARIVKYIQALRSRALQQVKHNPSPFPFRKPIG